MKDAIGGASLLNIVVIFTSIIILLFAGILAYSKAYKVKNRIIEVVEKNDGYNEIVDSEVTDELKRSGYRVASSEQINSKCGNDNLHKVSAGSTGHLYCVNLKSCSKYNENDKCIGSRVYEVVTYVHFEMPVVGNMLTFAVKGETKVLGKNYNY